MKYGGNQVQSCKNIVEVESHNMHLTSPASNYMRCCLQGKLIRGSLVRFLLRAVHVDTFCLTSTNFQTCRRKVDVQPKLHCFYKPFGPGKIPLSIREWRESTQNPIPILATKGQPCKQGFLRIAVSGLLC